MPRNPLTASVAFEASTPARKIKRVHRLLDVLELLRDKAGAPNTRTQADIRFAINKLLDEYFAQITPTKKSRTSAVTLEKV